MPLYWLCYSHNNQISVVIEPAASYVAALILETSADTKITATDAINDNVAATAPIDRNGAFSTSKNQRSEVRIRSLRIKPRVRNKART